MTRLGIVTPTLNAERYLEFNLRSIWSQKAPGLEIDHVIVDGGSSDRTREIASAFPSRVLVGRDGGMYEAINRGMESVEGDVLCYINADDEIMPGAIRLVARLLEPGARAVWVCGGMQYMDANGTTLATIRPVPTSVNALANLGWCPFPQQSTWFRRSFFERVGPFDTSFRYAADYDWMARALSIRPPSLIARTLGRFRIHEENLSSNLPALRAEGERVRLMYGKLGSAGKVAGESLRVLINARNPGFLLAKKTGRLRFWR